MDRVCAAVWGSPYKICVCDELIMMGLHGVEDCIQKWCEEVCEREEEWWMRDGVRREGRERGGRMGEGS